MIVIEIREYIDENGKSPFAKWFKHLDSQAVLKVTTYFIRMSHGNLSQVKSVGSGVLECRIKWGPGYRVYFGRDGEKITILLGGSTKKR